MFLQGNQINYKWLDNWAGVNGGSGYSHNGVVIDSQGKIYASFATAPYIRVFNSDGEMLDSFELSGENMHCIFISKDKQGEWLWNVDLANSIVTKSTLHGEIVCSFGRESFSLEPQDKFKITAGTSDPATGNILICDGYGWAEKEKNGGNNIYCFSPNFELLFSFDGSEADCGIFHEPHWIFADTRKGHTEIYIADRRKHRLVVYSAEGQFLRVINGDFNTPSGFASFDDKLVVAELEGRIHILDAKDNIIETMCDGSEYSKIEGWPNRMRDGEEIDPSSSLEIGKFNSPHGIAADSEGNIYVHEWHLGVRFTKLCRVTA